MSKNLFFLIQNPCIIIVNPVLNILDFCIQPRNLNNNHIYIFVSTLG